MSSTSLSTGDIAAYCSVTPVTVGRWISSGKLKGFQLTPGGHRRVRVSDFLAFLRENGMPIPTELRQTPRVLIVEDEAVTAMALRYLLSDAGYDTATAGNGFEAGALLTEFKPTVMTLDLRMPGLDGHGVLTYIREHGLAGTVRVIVVSAMSEDQIERALAAGADRAISKPFDPDDLLHHVRDLAGLPEEAEIGSGRP